MAPRRGIKPTVFLLLSLALILIPSLVVANIETTYELWVNTSSIVHIRPQLVNVLPAASGLAESMDAYVVQVVYNKTTQALTDPLIEQWQRTVSAEWFDTGQRLVVENPSGLAYSVPGLPAVSFSIKLLGVKVWINGSEAAIITFPEQIPILTLWNKIEDTYEFLAATIYFQPTASTIYYGNQTGGLTEFYIFWYYGEYNETTGNTIIRVIDVLYSGQVQEDIAQTPMHMYLLPRFYSYVDPADGKRYMVYGYEYRVKLGTSSWNGSFAYDVLKLYAANTSNYGVFEQAVSKAMGWDVWIGLGYLLYRSDLPPVLHAMLNPYDDAVLISMLVEDPRVFSIIPNTARLYTMFEGDLLGYYKPPGTRLWPAQDIILLDVALVVGLAVGVGLFVGHVGRLGALVGAPVLAFILSTIEPDARLWALTAISLAVAVLERGEG